MAKISMNVPIFGVLCLCAGVVVFAGCVNFEYPLYTPISQPTGRTLPLRVAIAYPDEGRSAPNRDEDVEPIITTQCVAFPLYISPRLEISRCLLDELRATQAFQVVDWVPELSANYDVIVHMRILSSGERNPRAAKECPRTGGPYQWEIVVTTQQGVELGRQRLTQAMESRYSSSAFSDIRKNQQVLLTEAVTLVLAAADRVARGAADIEGQRMLNYDDAHDPDLKGIRARLSALTLGPPERQALERDYLMRVAMLESLRVVEDQRIAALQPLKDRAWAEVQQKYRMKLQQLEIKVNATLQDSLQNNLGSMLSVAGVSKNSMLTAVTKISGMQGAAGGAGAEMAKLVAAPGGMEKLLAPAVRAQGRESGARLQLPPDPDFRAQLSHRLQILGRVPDPTGDPDGPWMKEYRRLVAGVVLPGDTPGPAPGDAPGGCTQDTDCKGDRICVNRACVDPPMRSDDK